ncbi:MAG: hypothetical protein ABIQ39_14870 [Ilumatobacteraceae bacterium]
MNAVILDVHGTLDLHSCDGFEGGWSGTLDLGGGFANGADQAATALTGLPAAGQGTFALGGLIALQPKAVPDDPAKPKLGVANTLGGKITLKFLDEDTAVLMINGTPNLNLSNGQVTQFHVTQRSDQCPS